MSPFWRRKTENLYEYGNFLTLNIHPTNHPSIYSKSIFLHALSIVSALLCAARPPLPYHHLSFLFVSFLHNGLRSFYPYFFVFSSSFLENIILLLFRIKKEGIYLIYTFLVSELRVGIHYYSIFTNFFLRILCSWNLLWIPMSIWVILGNWNSMS